MRADKSVTGVTPWDQEWFRVTFGPTYQPTSHSVLQFPIAFKLGMKYPKIHINGYSNLDFSISACGNRSSQFLIYWDTEWWNTVVRIHTKSASVPGPAVFLQQSVASVKTGFSMDESNEFE